MERLQALDPAITKGSSKILFDAIQTKLGMVPNMMRTMGNSPAVLKGYLDLSGALEKGVLGAKIGELIAVAVANANACEYCNAAHHFIGERLVHIDPKALADASAGQSADPKVHAVLRFALLLVQKKGRVSAQDIAVVKAAGYDDGGVAEIIAHVALNILTNYFNIAAGVKVDFPQMELVETAVI